MKLYRITATKYASDLTGTGGLFGPGRWHREGTRILYVAEYISLAKLEVLANSRVIPANQSLVTVEVPETASITAVDTDSLPSDWQKIPYLEELADITERWLSERQFWMMRVPSVHSPAEFNYLLNPLHPEHTTLKLLSIEPHGFDSRLK
ncbi:RES family NAD+ phosphorylase [Spirosoma sp. KUDC1026]|uniref:RES family NAD+ phosphorylase n=1 Tax=Spirosoma sp. KUDC1026 TaxID=2745947 RepID=UPI00159B8ED6|nr:RES family NAD+ phosphorylase [Spirosoma sp. KUDC1026]QKZ14533.1 RES family NAD+ phosphorylase [Spirosoma sp. KUDC1026]